MLVEAGGVTVFSVVRAKCVKNLVHIKFLYLLVKVYSVEGLVPLKGTIRSG